MADDMPTENNAASPPPPTEKTTTAKMLRSSQVPIDLLTEILVKLPVKSLLRLKSVSNSWNALISDPQFAKKQFQASAADTTRHHLLVSLRHPEIDSLRDYSLPSVFESSIPSYSHRYIFLREKQMCFIFLAGSCHGMLCVGVHHFYPTLWNPSTGKFNSLPLPLTSRYLGYCSSIIYGFGYDHSSDNYKVVAVICPCSIDCRVDFQTDFKVHTLGTDSWRSIGGSPVIGTDFDKSGKFVSGAINWLVKAEKSSSWVILSLDLGTETFQQLLPPDSVVKFKDTLTSGVLKGCLCIFAQHGPVLDIWLMNEYGNKESWIKMFSFGVPRGARSAYFDKRALCIYQEDDEILVHFDHGFVVYNSKSDTTRYTGIKALKFLGLYSHIAAEDYVESLMSPSR